MRHENIPDSIKEAVRKSDEASTSYYWGKTNNLLIKANDDLIKVTHAFVLSELKDLRQTGKDKDAKDNDIDNIEMEDKENKRIKTNFDDEKANIVKAWSEIGFRDIHSV